MLKKLQTARIPTFITYLVLLTLLVNLLSIIRSTVTSVVSAASSTSKVSLDRSRIIAASDAERYAEDLIKLEVELGVIPTWQGASAGTAVTHYDLSGTISAYVVPVLSSTHNFIGYVVVSAPIRNNPVLEFAAEGPPYLVGLDRAHRAAQQIGGKLITERPLYLGPLGHFYEITLFTDESKRQIFNVDTGDVLPIHVDQVEPAVQQEVIHTEPAAAIATVPSLQNVKKLHDVPHYRQFQTTYGRWNCLSGCAPTATASIMAYWSSKGYNRLLENGFEAMTRDLGQRMGTYCGGDYGWTDIGRVAEAIHGFASAKGYTFNSTFLNSWEATFNTYRSNIDEGNPPVVHLIYSNSNLNHSVAGMGYQVDGSFMIVRDNLRTESERFVNYGGAQVYLNTVRPLATIAVGQNSSRQQVFQIAYEATRQGTMYNINYGTPTTGAYLYRGLVRQDFSNRVSLIHDEGADRPAHSIPAYPIAGDFRTYWEQNLQQLGPPTSNQIRNGSGQDEQHFRHGRVRRISGRLVFDRWPTEADCVRQGRWRLEVINLFNFYPGGVDTRRGMTWPPNQNLSAGPSMVACVAPTKSGYALFYDVGRNSPYFERSIHDQGLWGDHWMARLSGKISGLPTSGFWPVSAACDDGCVIDIHSQTFPWWRQQIASWRDQPPSHLGRVWVQNGDQVNVTWYERTGSAAVWLKQGLQALTLPPLSAQCDAQIRIADGAPVINTPATTLTITAADAAEMKVSRLEDLSDASWQPVTTTLDWQLEPATGVMTHTVYAQFRDDTEETLCQGAIISDDILLDTLPPTGTATIAANDAISVTLQLDASDQPDGSGVEYVAIMAVNPDKPINDLMDLPETVWQSYLPTVDAFKPVTSMEMTQMAYQIWFRDAAGNIAEPITVAVPQVEPPPPPDEPTPDEPTPDEPTPDEPTPDEPTPDEPNPPPAERSQSVYLPLVIR